MFLHGNTDLLSGGFGCVDAKFHLHYHTHNHCNSKGNVLFCYKVGTVIKGAGGNRFGSYLQSSLNHQSAVETGCET